MNYCIPIPAVPPTTVGDHMIMLSYVLDISAVIHKAGALTLQVLVTIATTPFGQPIQLRTYDKGGSFC